MFSLTRMFRHHHRHHHLLAAKQKPSVYTVVLLCVYWLQRWHVGLPDVQTY